MFIKMINKMWQIMTNYLIKIEFKDKTMIYIVLFNEHKTYYL